MESSAPILVTGAGGKTGLAVLRRLMARAGLSSGLRAFVRGSRQRRVLENLGVSSVFEGDLLDRNAVTAALRGVATVYHICPNVHPQEAAIGARMLELAAETEVRGLVLHSVLHPQIRAMPHHWAKLEVEERIFESGLEYTILQPAPYMQNVFGQWPQVEAHGVYETPYATTTRIVMVDLEDVAEVAARVLTESGHTGATYELCGGELLDQTEIASILARRLGRAVAAEPIARTDWARRALRDGLDRERVETLQAMFRYYEHYGMIGSPSVLTKLLGRLPATFDDVVSRMTSTGG